jgi:hypothetical protein
MAKSEESASNTNNRNKVEKLPRLGSKRMAVLFAVLAIAFLGGIWGLRNGLAYRTSPSVQQCHAFKPKLYKGVRGQAGCVAAIQGFYNSKYGMRLDVDGIFGDQTHNVTVLYQAARLPSYPSVPASGIIDSGNFNRTWAKIAIDCNHPSPGWSSHCTKHFRY